MDGARPFIDDVEKVDAGTPDARRDMADLVKVGVLLPLEPAPRQAIGDRRGGRQEGIAAQRRVDERRGTLRMRIAESPSPAGADRGESGLRHPPPRFNSA